jgi:transposase
MIDLQRMETLYRLYGSYSRVAKELRASRNTVKKYLRQLEEVRAGTRTEILPNNREIHPPRRVLSPEAILMIHSLLEENLTHPKKQRMNCRQIHRKLVQSDFSVSYSTVHREIQIWKNSKNHREVYILQEPEPGYRAEFDWGELDLNINGIWTHFFIAVMVLTDSLYRFARIYHRESQQEVLDAHIQFFREIGSIPQVIFYDNLRAVYDYPRKVFQESFINFSIFYGFSYEVCNPYSPHEKGTDEESVGFVRSQAFSDRVSFESYEEAQKWLISTLKEINSNPVYRRDIAPEKGLMREHATMHPLPSLEFSNYTVKSSKISKYSMVAFDHNFYSVPDTYRAYRITLKIYVDQINLVDGTTVIASHNRLFGKGMYSLNILHYLNTFERKPGALQHSMVITKVPEILQELYHQHYLSRPLEFLQILSLIKEISPEKLVDGIDYLIENRIVPGYDTLRLVLFDQFNPEVEKIEIIDPVVVCEPDLSVYDSLMRCAA